MATPSRLCKRGWLMIDGGNWGKGRAFPRSSLIQGSSSDEELGSWILKQLRCINEHNNITEILFKETSLSAFTINYKKNHVFHLALWTLSRWEVFQNWLFILRIVNCNFHILAANLMLAEGKKEVLPYSHMCRVIDALIHQMNWNAPGLIIPPGRSPSK